MRFALRGSVIVSLYKTYNLYNFKVLSSPGKKSKTNAFPEKLSYAVQFVMLRSLFANNVARGKRVIVT